jgi:hypothetical protein
MIDQDRSLALIQEKGLIRELLAWMDREADLQEKYDLLSLIWARVPAQVKDAFYQRELRRAIEPIKYNTLIADTFFDNRVPQFKSTRGETK